MKILDGVNFCKETFDKLVKASHFVHDQCAALKLKGLQIDTAAFDISDGDVAYQEPRVMFEGVEVAVISDAADRKKFTAKVMFKVANKLADEEQAADLIEDIDTICSFVAGGDTDGEK